MINEKIIRLIREYNPWWELRELKELKVPEYKRYIFPDIEKYLRTKQIIAIIGLRRVGKTVLMKQVINELKIEKYNAFYFLFDDLATQDPELLYDILDYYLKNIAKEGRRYIFLDEIQKVSNWQDILKRFYDTREDIKFIVSGSASLQIRKSKESLAGRIFDFYLPILTYKEFFELNLGEIMENSGNLGTFSPESQKNISKRSDLINRNTHKKIEFDFSKFKDFYEANLHKKALYENMFEEYILKGAFPEIAKEKDIEIIKNYIKSSVTEKVIFEDIPAVFDIRRKDILSSILEYCARETSNLLDISNLGKILGADYQTIRSYLFYLKNSFILELLYNYSNSSSKQLRKNKKVHIAHPCIDLAMKNHGRNILEINDVVGRYVETIIFQHVKLLSKEVSFWRTPQKEEVDIILDKLPIEVKYRKDIKGSELKPMIKFMNEYKINKGYIISKDILSRKEIENKEILFVPAWLFLLSI